MGPYDASGIQLQFWSSIARCVNDIWPYMKFNSVQYQNCPCLQTIRFPSWVANINWSPFRSDSSKFFSSEVSPSRITKAPTGCIKTAYDTLFRSENVCIFRTFLPLFYYYLLRVMNSWFNLLYFPSCTLRQSRSYNFEKVVSRALCLQFKRIFGKNVYSYHTFSMEY